MDKAFHQSLTKQNVKVGFRFHEYGLSILNLWMKNQNQQAFTQQWIQIMKKVIIITHQKTKLITINKKKNI